MKSTVSPPGSHCRRRISLRRRAVSTLLAAIALTAALPACSQEGPQADLAKLDPSLVWRRVKIANGNLRGLLQAHTVRYWWETESSTIPLKAASPLPSPKVKVLPLDNEETLVVGAPTEKEADEIAARLARLDIPRPRVRVEVQYTPVPRPVAGSAALPTYKPGTTTLTIPSGQGETIRSLAPMLPRHSLAVWPFVHPDGTVSLLVDMEWRYTFEPKLYTPGWMDAWVGYNVRRRIKHVPAGQAAQVSLPVDDPQVPVARVDVALTPSVVAATEGSE